MNINLILVVCLVYCTIQVNCLRKFIRGRYFGKNTELSDFPDKYYNQRLDHFNEANIKTWKQRYWINAEHFDGSGPVFIMIGGEGEENPIWMNHGQWINFAKQYKALCVMLEHRYYGKSRPTEDLSTENMVYLSSRQGLADLAQFRDFIHDSYNLTDKNRWISFGGSYPGSLSAWFRLKYPHLIYGAVSSSAPMYALVDFTDYMVVVKNSLESYSPDCPIQIEAATKKVTDLMQRKSGRSYIEKIFKLCDPIDNDNDVINFYSALSGNFEGAVQYNKDNKAFEGGSNNLTIDLLCDEMINKNVRDPLQRYINVNDIMLNLEGENCLDASYSNFINEMKQISWNESAAVGGRQWTYQTCVEFGFFQSTDSKNQPFGNTVPVDFYIMQCKDIFGDKFDLKLLEQSIKDTNLNYGGYDYEGSRVVFVNGNIDPWHALGFTGNPPNKNTHTIFIEGTAHCADMYPSGKDDLSSLISARLKIGQIIGSWLSEE